MAKKVASFRLDTGLLDWIGDYAKSRGASQATVVEAAVESFRREATGGVPDLPVADTPEVRVQRAAAAAPVVPASSLVARGRANPLGAERQRAIEARRARGQS